MGGLQKRMREWVTGYLGASLEIRTKLDLERARERLDEASQPPTTWRQRLPPVRFNQSTFGSSAQFLRPVSMDPKPPLAGDVGDEEVKLWLRTRDPALWESTFGTATSYSSFYPILRGRLESTEEGAVLRGRLSVHRLVAIGSSIVAAAALGVATYRIASGLAAGLEAVFTALMASIAVATIRIGVARGGREVSVLRRELETLLETESEREEAAPEIEGEAVHHW